LKKKLTVRHQKELRLKIFIGKIFLVLGRTHFKQYLVLIWSHLKIATYKNQKDSSQNNLADDPKF
jgi:hypothetical protein